MYTGTLRKDMFADDRFVCGDMDAGESFHQATGIVDLLFPERCFHSQLVFQNGKHTAERSVSCTFAQAVQRGMNAIDSGTDGRIDIGNGQVIIVVSVEIKLQIRIAGHHILAIIVCITGIQDAQRIGQHEPAYRQVTKRIDKLIDIFRRILDTVRPVFQIDIHSYPPFRRQVDDAADIGKMLFGSLTQLLRHMLVRAFAK